MPLACNESTWSFINAISGETTTVKPSRINAGSWKQSDFPPPVGSTANTSFPASASRMISSCKGRNEVKPKYCFSSGVNDGAAACTTLNLISPRPVGEENGERFLRPASISKAGSEARSCVGNRAAVGLWEHDLQVASTHG